MKIFYILLSSCIFACGFNTSIFNESMIIGDWKQLYSNRFVQDTSEIDWDCVDVHVNEHLEIQKSPLVHHHFYSSNPVQINLKNNPQKYPDRIVFEVEDNLFLQYEVRDFVDNEYIVWTLNDQISLFIWTRDIQNFNQTYHDNVFRDLGLWKYNTYYKEPILSYTDFCLKRHLRHENHFGK